MERDKADKLGMRFNLAQKKLVYRAHLMRGSCNRVHDVSRDPCARAVLYKPLCGAGRHLHLYVVKNADRVGSLLGYLLGIYMSVCVYDLHFLASFELNTFL